MPRRQAPRKPGRRVVDGVRLKRLSSREYEYADRGAHRDYNIRREHGEWVVSAFDSRVKDPDEAFLDGEGGSFDSLEEATAFIKPRKGIFGLGVLG